MTIKAIAMDVDGVLTDGTVMMHTDGSETKGFNIRDGAAMVWAQRVGLTIGLLSARSSGATTQRAAQLAIRLVVQGVSSKLEAYTRILRDTGVPESAVAYMGDDLIDLPVLARAGLSAAPADAADGADPAGSARHPGPLTPTVAQRPVRRRHACSRLGRPVGVE